MDKTISPSSIRQRKQGGGRKRKLESEAQLSGHMESLLSRVPMEPSLFYWTYSGVVSLAAESRRQGFDVSHQIWADYFAQTGFRMTHNRNLPAQLSPADVDKQFGIISRSISSQRQRGGDVLFLEGAKVRITDVLREQGYLSDQDRFIPPSDYSFKEKDFHYCPPESLHLDEESETICIQGPSGPMYSPRLFSEEERDANKKKKREATILPLGKMITDRNTAMFTAIMLQHWLGASGSAPSKRVVLVTHGTTPDITYPDNWEWALNRVRMAMETPITVHRIPPATWRYAGAMYKLFSFTAQDRPEKAKDGYTITAWVLPHDGISRTEIKTIPAVFDFRRFPKSRKVTKKMRERIPIQRHAPYDCWNYSFGAGEESDA